MILYPPTCSGTAIVAPIDDAIVAALAPGDIVFIAAAHPRGHLLQPLVVDRVRSGAAYDEQELPYAVPVIEARGLVWGAADCYLPREMTEHERKAADRWREASA